jgi:hypothetical protein
MSGRWEIGHTVPEQVVDQSSKNCLPGYFKKLYGKSEEVGSFINEFGRCCKHFIFLVDKVVEPQTVLSKKSDFLETIEVDQSCCIPLQSGL